MSNEVLVTFTGRSVEEMIAARGCQAWALKPRNARRCSYVLATRNRAHPETLSGGPEPHQSAFLIGKISAVEPSPERPDRFIIRFKEYVVLDPPIPDVWPGSRNPVWYASDLAQFGIDEAKLQWQRIGDPPDNPTPAGAPDWPPRRLSIAEAKIALAETFGVPADNVEITIRG